MRFLFLSLIIISTSTVIIFLTITNEMGGTIDQGNLPSIYKTEASLLFFLDKNSSFYYTYPLLDSSAPVLQMRKVGHFIAYGFLAAIIFLIISTEKVWLRGFDSVVVSSSIGLIDELHQHFLIGRSGRLLDVYVNTAGAITASFILVFFWSIFKLRKKLILKYTQRNHQQQVG